MGFFRTTDRTKLNIPQQALVGGEAGFSDVFSAAFDSQRDTGNVDASQRLFDEQFDQAKVDFRNATGKNFDPSEDPEFKLDPETGRSIRIGVGPAEFRRRELESYNKMILELRERDPKSFNKLRTVDQLKEGARNKARISQRKFNEALEKASPFAGTVGGFAGALAGGFTDPVNILTLPIGAGASRTIMSAILIEAGVNASIETISQPQVASWNREIGNKYGFTEAIQGVGLAAVMGGTFTGVVRGIRPAVRGSKRVGSQVFRAIADTPGMKALQKRASKYMGRFAHIEEANPFLRATEREAGRHYESAQLIADAIEHGRDPMKVDLPITSREFNEIDTSLKGLDNDTDIHRATELKKFQEEVTPGTLPKDVSVPGVRKPIADKIKDRTGRVAVQEFTEEESRALAKAGVKSDPITQTYKVKDIENSLQHPALADQIRPREFEADTGFKSDEVLKEPNIDDVKRIDADEFETVITDSDISLKNQQQILKDSNSPMALRAQQKAFDDLAEANPNAKIVLDDRTVTLKDLLEEFAEDEKFLREVSFCGVG